jgi:hypothetical protein
VEVELEAIDLFDFAARETGKSQWDLLVAHAFLDLMDISTTLPLLFSLLEPGGLFYFTIVYDGVTILEPEVDPTFDALVLDLYHRTMDERITRGRPSGDSRAGRRSFAQIKQAGGELIAAGSSDWVVFPQRILPPSPSGDRSPPTTNHQSPKAGYPYEEAYFLHFIVHTIHQALKGRPEIDADRFEDWVAARHGQVERAELVYLAHQMDFVGRFPGI